MGRFIPYFHFENPSKKLTPEWCMEVVNFCVRNGSNYNLLEGKAVDEIESWASGNINMTPFKRMFKSIRKSIDDSQKGIDGLTPLSNIKDTTGLSWEPLPLIPNPLNSAVSTIQKIPIEVQCVAQDGLAMKKRKDDVEFLKSKPLIEQDLQELADQLQIGKVDIGTTKYSSKKFSEAPLGMDLNDPDEEDVFTKILYSLGVETANEKALTQFYNLKRVSNIKQLEIYDHFKFGVSCHAAYESSMTGLPDIEYLYPGDVECPRSMLQDFSDNTHRIINRSMTVLEMFNTFSDDITDEEQLEKMINGEGGYCDKNRMTTVEAGNWGLFRVGLKYVEVKSVDWIGVRNKKKSKLASSYFTLDEDMADYKIWGQNTYGFWWLTNTKYFFGIKKLDFSYRTKGLESYQNFSSNIYRSQKRSAVENCIGENKKAQIADIKMEHAIIKSLPAGKYVDLKFLRGALTGLKEEKSPYTIQDLINLAFEHNTVIGDSEGFDGKNDGQLKPVIPIEGGLRTEVAGYINVIMTAQRNIASFTGINEQLTGQSANPEGLVGMQKLLINSSINAIYYCNEAIRQQYESLFNLWANYIKYAIEAGGKRKQAIVNMIGIDDTELLDSLDETPLHNLTIKIQIGQREVERQMFAMGLDRLKKLGVLNESDEYILSGIENTKERFAYMAIKEKRFEKKQDKIRQEGYENQQKAIEQQGQNMIQAKQEEAKGDISKEYAKGEVQAKILELTHKLGLTRDQANFLAKSALQKDRNVDQKDKALSLAREKGNVKNQEPI